MCVRCGSALYSVRRRREYSWCAHCTARHQDGSRHVRRSPSAPMTDSHCLGMVASHVSQLSRNVCYQLSTVHTLAGHPHDVRHRRQPASQDTPGSKRNIHSATHSKWPTIKQPFMCSCPASRHYVNGLLAASSCDGAWTVLDIFANSHNVKN